MNLKEHYEKEMGKKWHDTSLWQGGSDGKCELKASKEYIEWLEQKAEDGQRSIEAMNKLIKIIKVEFSAIMDLEGYEDIINEYIKTTKTIGGIR
jgi:hypothetical protein